MDEVFKPIYIDGEKTKYVLSNKGRVQNTVTGKFIKPWHDPNKGSNGRTSYTLSHNGVVHTKFLSRWLGLTFLELPNGDIDDYDVDHKDGDSSNDDLNNLQWMLRPDNITKSLYDDGNCRIGEAHPRATMTDDTVETVIQLYNSGMGCSEIDRKLNLTPCIAYSIVSGAHWKHISSKYTINFTKKRRPPTKIDNHLKSRITMYIANNPDKTPKAIAEALGIEWDGKNGKNGSLIQRLKLKVKGSTTIERQPGKLIIEINLPD